MRTLGISRAPEFESDRELLRIDFGCSNQRFCFEYAEKSFASSVSRGVERPRSEYGTWKKECVAAGGFDPLKRFLALKR